MLDFIGNVVREFTFRASDRNLSSKLLCLVVITTSPRVDGEEISVSVSIPRKIVAAFTSRSTSGALGARQTRRTACGRFRDVLETILSFSVAFATRSIATSTTVVDFSDSTIAPLRRRTTDFKPAYSFEEGIEKVLKATSEKHENASDRKLSKT